MRVGEKRVWTGPVMRSEKALGMKSEKGAATAAWLSMIPGCRSEVILLSAADGPLLASAAMAVVQATPVAVRTRV